MKYRIEFSKDVLTIVAKYKKSNPIAFKKIIKLIPELVKHTRTGTGHPEPLVSGNSVTYSRRISANDHPIYDNYEDTVTVVMLYVKGHYGGK